MITRAIVDTLHGQLYLKKLCRHFAHKVPDTLNETQGRIEFPFGPCRIEVNTEQMHISIEVNDAHQVREAEKIHKENLQRMANRDQPQVEWHRESLDLQYQQTV